MNFRTTSLVTHASKIVLKILLSKTTGRQAKAYLGNDKFGFRRGCGTRDGIAVVRTLAERSVEHNKKLYICYVDYEKAFDRVNWVKMMEIMRNIGVDWRDRRLIKNLYTQQSAYVRLGDWKSEACMIGRGVRQGCTLSPLLFNLYDEAMMREATADVDIGVKVGGYLVKSVRFADDKAVMARSVRGLQELMDNINRVTKDYGMKINVKKTKVMCISRKGGEKMKIYIDAQEVEQVKQFKYLGSVISEDGYCDQDLKSRIAMGKNAFMAKKTLLTSRMDLELRKRIVKSTVWSVALYGAETWSMTQNHRKKLEAFEMWIWRKMLKISWTQKVSNHQVLDKIHEERTMLDSLHQRKHKWLGHILRHEGLLHTILEGRIEGKRGRGRKRQQMIDDIMGKEKYVIMKRTAEDRTRWIVRCQKQKDATCQEPANT